MAHVSFFKADMETRVDVALERDAEEARNIRLWNKEIDTRDRRQCRACGKHSDPEATGLLKRGHRHHIVYASACGSDQPFNRILLCVICHQEEHRDQLRFTADGGPYVGLDANGPLEFWRKDGRDGPFYLSRREVAAGVIERD